MNFGSEPEPRSPDDKKPVLIAVVVLVGLVLAGLAQAVLGGLRAEVQQVGSLVQANHISLATPAAVSSELQAAIETLARQDPGRSGVLVRSVEDGWVAGYRGATTFSQGSLRRIWLGAALLDAVDLGELDLEQDVPLMAAPTDAAQSRERVGDLLRKAVHRNEVEAQDHVLDGLMGSAGMAQWLDEKGIEEVVFGPSNRDLATLSARDGASLHSNVPDGATPDGLAFGLSQLFAGKLLSSSSTRLLQSFFTAKPGLAGQSIETGWDIVRMAGETVGKDMRPIAASGAALMQSHKGRRFVVVVFADGAADPKGRRDRLLDSAVSAVQDSEKLKKLPGSIVQRQADPER